MTDLITIETDAYGIDFTEADPDVDLLVERGCKFASLYLKDWPAKWVERALAAGVGVIPIGEVGQNTSAGGAAEGVKNAKRWVQLATQFGVPAGCPINLTQDTGIWAGQAAADYFVEGGKVLRDGGYTVGGYGGRKLFANTPADLWDLIWAWSAIGADPAPPNPHVQQGTGHNVIRGNNRGMWTGVDFDITGFGSVDTNVAKRPFTAWGIPKNVTPPPVTTVPPIVVTPPQPIPTPILEEDDMANAIYINDPTAPAEEQFAAEFFAVVNSHLAALQVEWTGDGSDSAVAARIAAHLAAGAVEVPVRRDGFKNATLLGPVPPGFVAGDFARVVG